MDKKNRYNNDLATDIIRLGNRGVRKAQLENRRLGIPNVYYKEGVIYYQLPNGEITTKELKEVAKN